MLLSDYLPLVLAAIALIAVMIGPFVQLSIAKRQAKSTTITVCRQQWINALRDELSEFFGAVYANGAIAISNDGPPKTGYIESSEKVMRLGTKIQLLLNPGEDGHARLTAMIRKACSQIATKAQTKGDALNRIEEQSAIMNELLDAAQKTLKRESERVKQLG